MPRRRSATGSDAQPGPSPSSADMPTQAPAPASAQAQAQAHTAATTFYTSESLRHDPSVGWLLKQSFQGLTRELHERMEALGVTPAQWPLLLFFMKQNCEPTAIEMARVLSMNAGAMTRMIDRLVEKGLLMRSRCPTDRRATRLSLTPAGHEALAPISAVLAETLNDLLRGFSRDEFQTLLALLHRLHANAQSLPTWRTGTPGAEAPAPGATGKSPRRRTRD